MIENTYRLVKSFERRIRRKLKRVDPGALPRDFEPEFKPIHDACRPFTMTGPLRMYVHVPPGPVGARVFGVHVVSLRYVASY